ncbi:MAG: HlyD family efflux transporter periplasmic adaptor subunit [Hyphomicrobiaceae bacterium]
MNKTNAPMPPATRTATPTAGPKPAPAAWPIGRIGGIAGALGIAIILAWMIWPKPIPVDISIISKGPMSVTVEDEGKTRIKDVFVVSAPVAGKMLRSPLLAGDKVEKNKTIVAVIQPVSPPFLDFRTRLEAAAGVKAAEAGVALAEAELVQARSELTFAESELTRTEALARTNNVALRSLEKAKIDAAVRKAAVAKAEANLAVRQRELESARARLVGPDDASGTTAQDGSCCLEVRAPESGRVLKVAATSEQVVGSGTPLVEIGNPRNLEIVVDLLSTDAVKVREGAKASIENWGGPTHLAAHVRRIETAGFTKVSALGIEEQRVRVILDLDPGQPAVEGLGHEFRVFVRIDEWHTADAVRVPLGALFRHKDKWAVFRMSGNRAHLVEVAIGRRNSDGAQVLGGLAPGDRVVLHPSDRVTAGVRVRQRAVEEYGAR